MDECCICYQPFHQRTDKIVIIKHSNDDTLTVSRKRGHYFHHDCIQQWKMEHGTCPLDRDPISRLYTVPDYQILGLEMGLYNYDYYDLLKNIKITDQLLEQFKSEADKNNKTLAFYACKLGNYALVTKLLKRGEDFNRPCGANGFTPLMVAVCHYHAKIVLRLLSNQSVQDNINVYDKSGNTAFSYACSTNQLSIIKEFITRKLVSSHQVRYSLAQYRSQYNSNERRDIMGLMNHYLKTDE